MENKLIKEIENIIVTDAMEFSSTKSAKLFTLTNDVAVRFAEWCYSNNEWDGNNYVARLWKSKNTNDIITTEQLFDYFLNNIYGKQTERKRNSGYNK